MLSRLAFAGAVAMATLGPSTADLVSLKPATLASFDRYVQLTESRMTSEISGSSPFLWINRLPQSAQTAALSQLRQGRVVSERLETRANGKEIDVPGGMIHHWIGTVLVPNAQLAQTRTFVQNYQRYPEIFAPMIVRSKVVSQTPDAFVVTMRTTMERVVTVVIDADYHVEYRPLSSTKLYSRSVAKNIFEVHSAGTASETRTPGDQSGGYLWRINTYCSFEETSGGTIEQCESISLTRGIPFGFGWLVGPFVSSIPRDTLEFTLGRVRAGAAGRW
jgi:hypothetical protein